MAYSNVKTEHAFQTFHKDLKLGIFPEVIFMHGEEEYLIQWAANSLADKFVDKGMRDIDFVKAGESEDVDELLAMCDTFSMLSERRIIWAKDYAPLLKKSSKESVEYCDAMFEIKDAMSDVLGVSSEFLSDDFIINNMADIEKQRPEMQKLLIDWRLLRHKIF